VSVAPTVSVIVPAFDAERFLGEALDGVLAQDYPADRVEIIVVDDGSTDATRQIAARHAAADDRIRVLHRANGGQVAATNTALEHATGDLIALLDADDVWVRDKLRRSVAVLEARPEVGLVYGDMTVIDAERRVLQESWLEDDVTPEGLHCAGALIVGNNVTCSSVVLRGSVLRAVTPIPAEMPWSDWWIAVRVAQVSELAYLAEPRTLYRFHGANMSLGAQGGRRREELVKAAGFQRHVLRTLAPGDATPRELLAGWEALDRNIREARELGAGVILEVTPADRARAGRLAAEARAGGADGADGLWPAVRAVAADPEDAAARAALAAALVAGSDGASLPGRHPLDGAAPFVVLADAAELFDDPALLGAYAAAMAGGTGVTLAIDATALHTDEAAGRLGTLVADAGVGDDVDLLAVTGTLDEIGRARLAAGVRAILGDRPDAPGRPRFGAATAAALRDLAGA
jgi:hypothetical protein